MSDRHDIHQSITDQIVSAIEAGAGEYKMPWHMSQGSIMRPENIGSRKPYQGINILALWVASQRKGYASPVWGTFKQWVAQGCSVRGGEKATYGVIYKETRAPSDAGTGDEVDKTLVFARAFALFNADQVNGYTPFLIDPLEPTTITPMEEADRVIAATKAVIIEQGESAFYRPSTDEIVVPPRERFTGSEHRSPTEAYYGVKLHELIHWTGAKHRLDRDLTGRFGTNAYAMEELVAELGAAFLCADLDISSEPRRDHAQYLANWLEVLRNDKRAIFTAAGKAQIAARHVHECGWVAEARLKLQAVIDEKERHATVGADPAPTPPDETLPLFASRPRSPR